MNAEQGILFLKAIGAKNLQVREQWITASCPLAFLTHKNNKDSNPSFGLSLGTKSFYNCFACGRGSAVQLLQSIAANGEGVDIPLATALLEQEASTIAFLPGYSEFANNETTEFSAWPEYWIDSFLLAGMNTEAALYLGKRDDIGVPVYQWEKFELHYDTARHMIVCPFRNVWGELAGARGRFIGKKDKDTPSWQVHFDYGWNNIRNTRMVWYNEQALQLDGWVVVVEGQFDCMRIDEKYKKVVANLTALPTHPKLMKLLQSDGVIHIPDNDMTGEKSVVEYQEFCKSHKLRYKKLSLPDGIKDASECNPDYIFDRIMELHS